MTRCRGADPTPVIQLTANVARLIAAMRVLPMTATYAVPLTGSIAIPRGYGPSGIVVTILPVDVSMMLSLYEHQFDTSRYLPLGVTATNFGTAPTSMT